MPYQTSCACCGEILNPIINFGNHPHSDYFPKDIKSPIKTYPLGLSRCNSCGMYQTDYHLPSDEMFNEDYIYDSSINQSGREHWNLFAKDLTNIIDSRLNKINSYKLLDVGSNSGELLSAK